MDPILDSSRLFLKNGQPIVDHHFFDHLKSVFFNSETAKLIFTILLDGFYRFFTHIRLLLIYLRLLLHWVFSRVMGGLLFFFCSDFREEIIKRNRERKKKKREREKERKKGREREKEKERRKEREEERGRER